MFIAISGISGSGKNTVMHHLTKMRSNLKILERSTATTRERRESDETYQTYIYMSEEEFKKGIDKGIFIEYENVHGFYYGTLKEAFQKVIEDKENDYARDIDVKGVIGNTPMIKIDYEKNGKQKSVYCKLEYYNLTGSIKDRVAYYIIVNAKLRGDLKDSMPIVEATSGNTGIALSALGAFFGHPVFIYMPEWVSKERIKIMKSFGASVYLVSEEQGGFKRCIEEANNKAKEVNGFLANQFSNYDNILAHYETTGKEILDKLPKDVYGFVSGVGTGGTLMGTGKRLKENLKYIKIVAIEPDKMPIISQGKILGQHKIEGIGDEFVPDLLDKNFMIGRLYWSADYSDPMSMMSLFTSYNTQNNGGYSNKRYDDLIGQAMSTDDNNIRMKAMHEAEKILIEEDMGAIPLYFFTEPLLVNPKLKDVVYNPLGFHKFFYAYLEK